MHRPPQLDPFDGKQTESRSSQNTPVGHSIMTLIPHCCYNCAKGGEWSGIFFWHVPVIWILIEIVMSWHTSPGVSEETLVTSDKMSNREIPWSKFLAKEIEKSEWKFNFPHLSLMIRAVFTVLFPFLWSNILRERCAFCMNVCLCYMDISINVSEYWSPQIVRMDIVIVSMQDVSFQP